MAFLIAETDVPSCPVWGPRPSCGFHHKGAEPRPEPFETTITPKQPDNQTPSSPQKVKRPCQGVAMKEKPLPPREGDICCQTPREQPTWAKEHGKLRWLRCLTQATAWAGHPKLAFPQDCCVPEGGHTVRGLESSHGHLGLWSLCPAQGTGPLTAPCKLPSWSTCALQGDQFVLISR